MIQTRLSAAILTLLLVSGSAGLADEINFGRDIRPLLSDRCFKCHGPDRHNSDNDLQLDTREGAIESAVIPGNAKVSELIARITSNDDSLKMPPVDSDRKPLTPDEIGLLKRWVDEGANYAEHWAYVAPVSPPVPEVRNSRWPHGPIDQFILAGVEQHGKSPARDADRRTLIRRLSFDLLGLPPSPAEVQAFVEDRRPEAYEALVDRLLASPHYGERMAMHWLDLVRYADTIGYHSDNEREVDLFRDYTIDAFNDNKPFDQFTIEQLAGDLLPNPTDEQLIASGYNRLLQTTQEGGAQAKEYTAIYLADRVRNVSTVWMGSTMGCCQCHDHKFDPFSIRDFYSMGAFFADVKEVAIRTQPPNFTMPTSEQQTRIQQIEADIESLKATPLDPHALAAWVAEQRAKLADVEDGFKITPPIDPLSEGGAAMNTGKDHSVVTGGADPDFDTYTIRLATSDELISGMRLEVFPRNNFPKKGLSRGNGNFVLSGFAVEVRSGGVSKPVKIQAAVADYEQKGFPISATLDDDDNTGWSVDGDRRQLPCTAIFSFAEPVRGGDAVELVVTMENRAQPHRNVGAFRLSTTTSLNPLLNGFSDLPSKLVATLGKSDSKLSDSDRELIVSSFRQLAPAHASVRKQLEEVEQQLKEIQGQVRTMLIAESLPKPREVRVLPRGNWQDDSGEVVQPAIPVRFGTLPVADRRATRLDLAQWLVKAENPLTARVFVNRIWKLMYGYGLSRSLEDVGYQGDWPTHPELLDWLAVDFVEHGWDVKRLVKQLVMSHSYQQSSQGSPADVQTDPFNKLMTRQNSFRLNAEMIRDNALTASGLIVLEIGGQSVKPYQPAGYWAHLNFPMREWENGTGSDLYRRGLYTFWCRSFLHPSLLAFDASTREECTADRPRSNTPLQALVLLNDPTYVEAARVLAQRTIPQSGTDTSRLNWMSQQVLQRDCAVEEADLLLGLLARERLAYQAHPDKAREVQQNGATPVAESVDPVELAAWTTVGRVLLNLHETITRD